MEDVLVHRHNPLKRRVTRLPSRFLSPLSKAFSHGDDTRHTTVVRERARSSARPRAHVTRNGGQGEREARYIGDVYVYIRVCIYIYIAYIYIRYVNKAMRAILPHSRQRLRKMVGTPRGKQLTLADELKTQLANRYAAEAHVTLAAFGARFPATDWSTATRSLAIPRGSAKKKSALFPRRRL